MPSTNKTPIPVCISIRNFFPQSIPKSSNDQHQESKATSCMNRNESINLPPCQLDIIDKSEDNIRIICSLSARGAHPLWNHLDEKIDQGVLDDSIYARFTIHNKLIEVPLCPSKLNTISQSDNITTPESLPPNAILIHYDDGRTRVVPSLYSLLVKRNVVQEFVEVEKGEVFSESTFDVLGDIDGAKSLDEKQISVTVANSDAMYDDKIFDLLGDETLAGDKSFDEAVSANEEITKPHDSPNAININARDDNEVALTENSSSSAAAASSQSALPDPPLVISESDDVLIMQRKMSALRQQMQKEQDLLKREEMMIHQETSNLKSIIKQVQQLQRETSEIIDRMGAERVNLFRANFHIEAHRAQLLKRLRLIFPIKLVRLTVEGQGTLTNSAPSQHQFTISGIPLPDDIHHPATSDDQVSTALGFTCHLIALVSKYLDIPMRYRIVCKFSRSVVVDEGRGGLKSSAIAYPLFRERGVVDREQLDHGLTLLTRNADALLRMMQVDFRDGWNILAKLDRLLSYIVDGKEF